MNRCLLQVREREGEPLREEVRWSRAEVEKKASKKPPWSTGHRNVKIAFLLRPHFSELALKKAGKREGERVL